MVRQDVWHRNAEIARLTSEMVQGTLSNLSLLRVANMIRKQETAFNHGSSVDLQKVGLRIPPTTGTLAIERCGTKRLAFRASL